MPINFEDFDKHQITKTASGPGRNIPIAPAFPAKVAPPPPPVLNQQSPSPDRQALARGYARRMRNGLIWAVIGVVVTTLTFSLAQSSGGGHYIVAWGAILFGIIDFLIGFCGWLRYRF